MVEKVYDYIARKNPGKSVNWFVKECAEATGVSVSTIYKIRSEASCGPLVSPIVVLLCAIKLCGTVLRVRKRTSVIAPSLSLFP